MVSPSQRSTVASAPKSPTIKSTKPTSSSAPAATSTKRTSTTITPIPRTRPPSEIKKQTSLPPIKKTSPVSVPGRARSSTVTVSTTSKMSSVPGKPAVSQSLPAQTQYLAIATSQRTVARASRPVISNNTTANQDREDRLSRLTRPTRSSSQKSVDAGSRPSPKRPPGVPRVAGTTSTEAGKRPRSGSVVSAKSAPKPTRAPDRTGTRYGNSIPRPAACKNAALLSSSTKVSVSSVSVSSKPVDLVEATEVSASEAQQNEAVDIEPDVPDVDTSAPIASVPPIDSASGAQVEGPPVSDVILEAAATDAVEGANDTGSKDVSDHHEASVEIATSAPGEVDGQSDGKSAKIPDNNAPEDICEARSNESDELGGERCVVDDKDTSVGHHTEEKIVADDQRQIEDKNEERNGIIADDSSGKNDNDGTPSLESESKDDVPAVDSLSDVIQYYSSESSSEDGATSEDSETTPSDSTSFGSLVGAYSGLSDSEDDVPSANDMAAASESSLSSLLEAYSGSSSESETSTDDRMTTPTDNAPSSSPTDESIDTCATSPPASPIPDKLTFHPSHHPEGFLRIPVWSYESRLSRRTSSSHSKPNILSVKPLRVAPKPPIANKSAQGCISATGVFSTPGSSPWREDVKREESTKLKDVRRASNRRSVAPTPVALDITSLLRELEEDEMPEPPRGTVSDNATQASESAPAKRAAGDPLDEDFCQDPFLESLRWLYTSRIQLWRSEVIDDEDDDDDDEEQAVDEDFDTIASRMAARVAAWRPTDEVTPAVKELRDSFVQLQAMVSEIEQDQGLLEGGSPAPASDNDVKGTVTRTTSVDGEVQSMSGGDIPVVALLEEANKQVDKEIIEAPRLTAAEKGKARLEIDQHETQDDVTTSRAVLEPVLNVEDFLTDDDTSGETFLSYLPLPETPKFFLGGTWTLAVVPSAGYTSPSSRSHQFFGEQPTRSLRGKPESLPNATTSYWTIGGSHGKLPHIHKPATASLSVSPPIVEHHAPIPTKRRLNTGVHPDNAGDALVSPACHTHAQASLSATAPPPSPVVSEASIDDSDGAASDISTDSPMLSGHCVAPSPVSTSPVSTVGRGSGFSGLFSRWF
ncbi:hypothetical protein EVJ58_g1138 [Rhodofomes roseus]|uniref:Uncharacterized protein n=1 Tax=Rhodofomes roseus TaxID=34475 RepID=A0A4Y9Z2U7_9APHY|nr:hypothetical protein EVJ58_g1138 [Rhodofomes roseus]